MTTEEHIKLLDNQIELAEDIKRWAGDMMDNEELNEIIEIANKIKNELTREVKTSSVINDNF